jgi:hypothetical protein
MQKLILVILIALLYWSCDENSVSVFTYESEATESHSINLTTQTTIIVYNTNGNITITSSDTASNLYCDIVKKVKSNVSESDAQSHIPDIDISIEENVNNTKFDVDHPTDNDRNYEINFDIILPNNLNYDIALGNGNITLGSRTKLAVINLGNGNVTTDLTLEDTCAVSIAVGNGNINFAIPGNTNANLIASVGNGTISNTGLNFTNQQSSNNQFNGTLGNGAGSIVLSIGNGNIIMIKK